VHAGILEGVRACPNALWEFGGGLGVRLTLVYAGIVGSGVTMVHCGMVGEP